MKTLFFRFRSPSVYSFLIMLMCLNAVRASVGDQYYVNVVSDAFYMEESSNELGSIEFADRGNGLSYNYLIRMKDGSIVQGFFTYETPSLGYLDAAQKSKDAAWTTILSWSSNGQYNPINLHGTLTFNRNAGSAIGDYVLTESPIGKIAGKFFIVEFAGTLTIASNGHPTGDLVQQRSNPKVPQRLYLGPDSNDDIVGTDVGRNYYVDFSTQLLIVDGASPGTRSWRWFRGSAVKVKTGDFTVGDIILELQSAEQLGQTWQTVTSLALSADKSFQVFRLTVRKR